MKRKKLCKNIELSKNNEKIDESENIKIENEGTQPPSAIGNLLSSFFLIHLFNYHKDSLIHCICTSQSYSYLVFPKCESLNYQFYNINFAKKTFKMKIIFKIPKKTKNDVIHSAIASFEKEYEMEFPEFTTDELFEFRVYEENGYCFVEFPKKLEDFNAIYIV